MWMAWLSLLVRVLGVHAGNDGANESHSPVHFEGVYALDLAQERAGHGRRGGQCTPGAVRRGVDPVQPVYHRQVDVFVQIDIVGCCTQLRS